MNEKEIIEAANSSNGFDVALLVSKPALALIVKSMESAIIYFDQFDYGLTERNVLAKMCKEFKKYL